MSTLPRRAAQRGLQMRVLAASDLTPRSGPPLARARRLAPSETHVLHVIEADLPTALISTLRPAARATLCAEAATAGLLAEALPEVAMGLPHLSIADTAKRLSAEMILMGRHRQESLGEVFVGTTLERVIRQAERPVLVCHDPQARPWREVIFTTDLSPASLEAARWFARSGLAEGARIVLAHAFVPLGQGLFFQREQMGQREQAGTARETRDETQHLQDFATEAGLQTAECLLLAGSPAATLAALVLARQPDLLVMGTRGPSGLRRGMIGSVAQTLLRSGRLDMLAIPPKAACAEAGANHDPAGSLDAGLPDPAASSNQGERPPGAD